MFHPFIALPTVCLSSPRTQTWGNHDEEISGRTRGHGVAGGRQRACSAPAKEVTPQACINAIDHSNEIIKLATDVIDISTRVNYKWMSSDAAIEAIDEIQPNFEAES